MLRQVESELHRACGLAPSRLGWSAARSPCVLLPGSGAGAGADGGGEAGAEAGGEAAGEVEAVWLSWHMMEDEGLRITFSDVSLHKALNLGVTASCPFSTHRKPFESCVWRQTNLIGIAVAVVFVYIVWTLRSLALGLITVSVAFASLPLATIAYPFRFLVYDLVAVFLCLGIGADDCFVFIGAWRFSKTLPRIARLNGEEALRARLRYSLTVTRQTCAATSLTSAIAFGMMAFGADVFAVASFGLVRSARWTSHLAALP